MINILCNCSNHFPNWAIALIGSLILIMLISALIWKIIIKLKNEKSAYEMKVFSIIIFIAISIILLVYFAILFYQKIKIIRKYCDKVKELKGTAFTKNEKYTVVKLFDYIDQ